MFDCFIAVLLLFFDLKYLNSTKSGGQIKKYKLTDNHCIVSKLKITKLWEGVKITSTNT